MTTKESFGNYNLIKRVKLNFTDVVVSKWKSSVTGLTVIHLDYDGSFLLCPLFSLFLSPDTSFAAPIVNGYFIVPTESTSLVYFVQLVSTEVIAGFDDSGCPHTLEQYAKLLGR